MSGSVDIRDELLEEAFDAGIHVVGGVDGFGGSCSDRSCQNGVSQSARNSRLSLLFEV